MFSKYHLLIGKDSCNGDSGGPLIQKDRGVGNPWFQVGVVSFGTSKCGAGQPGMYIAAKLILNFEYHSYK